MFCSKARVNPRFPPLSLYARFLSEQSFIANSLGTIKTELSPTAPKTDPRAQTFLVPENNDPIVHILRGLSTFIPHSRVFTRIGKEIRERWAATQNEEELPSEVWQAIGNTKLQVKLQAQMDWQQVGSSFFILDPSRVAEKYMQWCEELPMVHAHYAVKSNPNPAIVHKLASMGANFDCATAAEIDQVLQAGISPSRIILAHPCKPPSHVSYARHMGVTRTTFDSEAEIYKIRQLHPQAELVLRIWVDDRHAQCPLSNKYGAHPHEWETLLVAAKFLGLNVIGVSFHVGSGGRPESFVGALEHAAQVRDIGRSAGHSMKILDIGGGFPGTDEPQVGGITLSLVSKLISPILEKEWADCEVIAEPGRFMCSEAQTLVTQIIGKRVRQGRHQYFINDGTYQSFNCMMYDHAQLLPEDESSEVGIITSDRRERYSSDLFGQTCDGIDQIASGIYLPDLRVGDWIAVPSMGAYTNGAASQFNGFPTARCVVLDEADI